MKAAILSVAMTVLVAAVGAYDDGSFVKSLRANINNIDVDIDDVEDGTFDQGTLIGMTEQNKKESPAGLPFTDPGKDAFLAVDDVATQCFTRTYTFGSGISADWDQQTTQQRQNTIDGVWAMHSNGQGANNWSRMRYAKYTFNNHDKATTRIKVTVRGAPDSGKNSNAYLIETKGIYNLDAAIQDRTKDEIDFFEFYGSGGGKNTINVFRSGKVVSGYPKTLTNSKKAGYQLYTYELILKKQEKYMLVMVFDATGKEVERYQLVGDSVPSKPMELFIGIWDCSAWCGSSVNYDTWMGVKSVFIEAC